jgi:hypothetical protein
MAQVRSKAKLGPLGPNRKSHRVCGVVGHTEGLNLHIAQTQFLARLEEMDVSPEPQRRWQIIMSTPSHIDGNIQLPGEDAQTTDVIPVLVGHENGAEPVYAFTHGLHALRQLLKGKTIVN